MAEPETQAKDTSITSECTRVMDLDHLPPGMVTAHQKILIIDNILSFMHIETSSAIACFGQTPQAGCSSVASFEHQEMQGAVNVLGFH